MESMHKTALLEVLSRKDGTCSFADAVALHGVHPAEILARLSFAEFSQLIARIQAQSAPADDFTKEST